MIELDLSGIAHTIVNDLIEIRPDEELFVVCDPERERIARSVASAARGTGATAMVNVMPRLRAHGNEPPRTVAAAMKAADAVVAATNTSLSHTRARREAADAGTRTFVLRGVTEETMIEGGVNTDYDELRRRTALVRDALVAADEAAVTSPTGTDVTLDIAGRRALSLDGFFHGDAVRKNASVPTGEAPTSPAEGTTDGTVVVDHSMDNLGPLDEPVALGVEGGHVISIEGGEAAEELRRVVDEHDEGATNLAEFAIGTNPDARLSGVLAEDKKVEGTVHFAIGDNVSLGGSVESDLHLDGMVTRPTVSLDGTTVIEGREVDWGAMRDVAGR